MSLLLGMRMFSLSAVAVVADRPDIAAVGAQEVI
jgi:hypothetical protein